MSFELILFNLIIRDLPVVRGQVDGKLNFRAFESSTADPVLLASIVGGVACAILLTIYCAYKYRQWKQYKEFENEMKSLDLNPDQEGTLASLVKRNKMQEPVNILFSVRLFDELAAAEIVRVLGSQASMELKKDFIERVYQIRIKTYHPDWLHSKQVESKVE